MTYSVSSVEFVTIMFLSVAIVIVTIVITIIIKKMTLSQNPMEHRMMTSKLPISPKEIDERVKKIYLNYNGAYQSFNSSDIAYDEVGEMYLKQDLVKMYLRDLFKTSLDSSIIFNSGATECIASCINWFLHYCPYGTIYGSSFDHPTIEETCKFKGICYRQLDEISEEAVTNIDDIVFSESALFITTVNPSTGEINSLDYNLISKFRFVFVDVCQSVGKLNFDCTMLENQYTRLTSLPNIGLFFSLHKLNKDHYGGIMVIEDEADRFIPLIYGRQQNSLRGGSYDLSVSTKVQSIIENYKKEYKPDECKKLWNLIIDSLEEKLKSKPNSNLIHIYKPKTKHLYNTILLTYDKCVMGLIQDLSKENIYVTAKTSCVTSDEKNITNTQSIRLSFINNPFINCPEKFDYLIERLTD